MNPPFGSAATAADFVVVALIVKLTPLVRGPIECASTASTWA